MSDHTPDRTLSHAPDPQRLAAARQALAEAERTASAGVPVVAEAARAARSSDQFGHDPNRQSGHPGSSSDLGVDHEAYVEAKRIVLRQLAVAPRSRHQLAEKLRQRGCEDTVASVVLDRMTDAGLVDDEAFARMFVRTRQDHKGLAARAIAQELRDKGIAEHVVDDVLTDIDTDVEKEKARELVAKRLRTMHGLDRDVQVRRLAGLLARKGYNASIAYHVVSEALDQAVEHRRD